MLTIIAKDALRARIEKASGGKQTVLYTAKGQPSHMNIVPGWRLEDIAPGLGQGLHPAFIVDGHEKREFFYGSYAGTLSDGELLSLPDMPAACRLDFDMAWQAARACGQGWHLSSNAERAALMLWSHAQGCASHGNTQFGQDAQAPGEKGVRIDGGACGLDGGEPAVLTGSGPYSWRHDHSPHGIADLTGNLWEWQTGLRLVDGEVQVIPDNNAVHASASADSRHWKAICLSDGALVEPGTVGTAKLDAPTDRKDGNAGLPVWAEKIGNRNGMAGSNANSPGLLDAAFDAMRADAFGAFQRLAMLGLAPHARTGSAEQVYLRNYGERIFLSGGAWYSGAMAGQRTLCLSHPRGHASTSVGARPAFIL
ncbi:hypothetical protein [Comamonas composti]|uniref:hypothetical protein n=1 Tax=Comamonas composti TaxID=408558 RepID=UPI00040CC523|nr:hypothetical protein [Comamonas composti]